MQHNWLVSDIIELDVIAIQLLSALQGKKKIAFTGMMGAGKTTLIAALCKALRITDNISSPTFSIVQEYAGETPVFHFDLYRIKNVSELEDLGFEEYISSDAYVFIEWPEMVAAYLKLNHFAFVSIRITTGSERMINLDL